MKISIYSRSLKCWNPLLLFIYTFILWLLQHTPTPAQTAKSFRQPHPMNWIHVTPVGEPPGWAQKRWMTFEFSQANVWNAPLTMTHKKTGQTLTYEADFEQSTLLIEWGKEMRKNLSSAVTLPVAYRGGGILDNFIESYHEDIGSRTFNRNLYSANRNNFKTSTDSQAGYGKKNHNGIAFVLPQLKWWFKKCKNVYRRPETCGLALSTQLKIPTQSRESGASHEQLSLNTLFHAGRHFGSRFSVWSTLGYTHLRDDKNMPGWPLQKNHWMFEVSSDFHLYEKWGLILKLRTQSPFLDRDQLTYVDNTSLSSVKQENRASTAWNSLIRWQGMQAFGFRYNHKKNSQWQFLFVEDWGLGNYDAAYNIYSNNAPDVNLVVQYHRDY